MQQPLGIHGKFFIIGYPSRQHLSLNTASAGCRALNVHMKELPCSSVRQTMTFHSNAAKISNGIVDNTTSNERTIAEPALVCLRSMSTAHHPS